MAAASPSTRAPYEMTGRVAVVLIDNPPVNALSHHVRVAIVDAIEAASRDPAVDAVVIAGSGTTFPSGADIREFGKPSAQPTLPEVIAAIERCPKPTVAAITGSALGGGYELSLGCDYRIAASTAFVGLPEVTLGLIPGAGGTQRLPRLIAPAAALDIITAGRRQSAAEALALGMVDAVVDDPVTEAIRIAPATAKRPLSKRTPTKIAPDVLEQARVRVTAKARGQASPVLALQAFEAAFDRDFAQGLARERELFVAARDSEESAALRGLFFAEKEASRLDELKDLAPSKIASVGIVGGGTMGAGIAVSVVDAGIPTVIVEKDGDAAEAAKGRVEATWARLKKSGKMNDGGLAEKRALLTIATTQDALSDRDLIIEAVFEDMAVKTELFGRLGKLAKPGAILATNTSYLDVDRIAKAGGRATDSIGLHFFSPANVMKLLEVVRGAATSPEVLVTSLAFAKRIGKIAVVSGVCDGFIGNRIFSVYRRQCNLMLEEGQTPYEIDKALEAFGMAMGPFAVSDLAGLDIGYAQNKRLAATRDSRERYMRLGDELVEAGRLGRKSGRGWYLYDDAGARQEDPDVLRRVCVHAELPPVRRSSEEIARRCIVAMANEGAKILEEGIAQRAWDIDVVLTNGYGFPRWRGGPMFWASRRGDATMKGWVAEVGKSTGFGFSAAKRYA